MMKFDLQLNSYGFDSDNLDDWLESDLKQSGILPLDNNDGDQYIKLEDPSDWERHSCSDGSDDKTVVDDFELDNKCDKNNNNKKHTIDTQLPIQLAPILTKALAVLTSLQQQGIALPELLSPNPSLLTPTSTLPLHTPDAINPMHMTKSPTHTQAPPQQQMNSNDTSTKRRRDSDNISSTVEPLDHLALKRQKNTDAARRSRQRKVMKMEALESRVRELEKHNQQLLLQAAVAENDRDAAKVKESKQRKKVAALEAQLAESHQQLQQQSKKNKRILTTRDHHV